jgi:putative nucleotidyltransferase with HDIG domain
MGVSNIKEKVQNIINLPSLPNIAMEIIGVIDNPETSIQTLSNIISKDLVLASKILKVANSPFYSYPRVISTIDFALIILGTETVKEIMVSISFISHFKKFHFKDFDLNKFWAHSILSSVIARELAKEIGYKVKGEAFVAALIHDIGIFITSQFFHEEYNKLTELIKTEHYDLYQAEKELYGATHADIGGWLLERWNFPPQLVEAIKYHHSPKIISANPQLSSIMYYTEYLTNKKNLSTFEIEEKTKYTLEYLPMLTFENMAVLDNFFEKNKTIFQKETEKVQYFL